MENLTAFLLNEDSSLPFDSFNDNVLQNLPHQPGQYDILDAIVPFQFPMTLPATKGTGAASACRLHYSMRRHVCGSIQSPPFCTGTLGKSMTSLLTNTQLAPTPTPSCRREGTAGRQRRRRCAHALGGRPAGAGQHGSCAPHPHSCPCLPGGRRPPGECTPPLQRSPHGWRQQRW